MKNSKIVHIDDNAVHMTRCLIDLLDMVYGSNDKYTKAWIKDIVMDTGNSWDPFKDEQLKEEETT